MKGSKTVYWLLLVGGVVHAIPALYRWLSETLHGPWIQVLVGVVSVIVALTMLSR